MSVNFAAWVAAPAMEVFPIVTWEEGLEGLTCYLGGRS
jgi:hypothetical protein